MADERQLRIVDTEPGRQMYATADSISSAMPRIVLWAECVAENHGTNTIGHEWRRNCSGEQAQQVADRDHLATLDVETTVEPLGACLVGGSGDTWPAP